MLASALFRKNVVVSLKCFEARVIDMKKCLCVWECMNSILESVEACVTCEMVLFSTLVVLRGKYRLMMSACNI